MEWGKSMVCTFQAGPCSLNTHLHQTPGRWGRWGWLLGQIRRRKQEHRFRWRLDQNLRASRQARTCTLTFQTTTRPRHPWWGHICSMDLHQPA